MLDLILEEHRKDLGGFEVGRVLPSPRRRMIGPFIFFDHLGPVDFEPGFPKKVDVRPHPHIGLSTVTYLFAGQITHRDSVGSEQAIQPGAVNWMTAGSGITHSERFERLRETGGTINAIQSWVALPEAEEERAPAFTHHGTEELPRFEAEGALGRLIAGEAYGVTSLVKTHSPMFYVHWVLAAGAIAELPHEYPERAAYIVSGSIEADGHVFESGRMLVFKPGSSPVIRSVAPAVLMLLGGEPIGQRFIEWNFVSSSKDRIEQAKADWRAGRMKLPDLDSGEFVPLPSEPATTQAQML